MILEKLKEDDKGEEQKSMSKQKIGFTCSCFDLLHAGHILMLKDAKEQCDYLNNVQKAMSWRIIQLSNYTNKNKLKLIFRICNNVKKI